MSITLNQSWQIFYENFSSSKVIGATDLSLWANHIRPFFQDVRLEEINTFTILDFKKNLETQSSLSPQSIKHCLALIRRIYKKMSFLDIYTGKIPKFIMPVFDNKRLRFLSKDEAIILLNVLQASSDLWYAITCFALHTGMRTGEIFSLRCCNIDLDKYAVYVLNTKTQKNRIVPLNETASATAKRFYSKPNSLLFRTANDKKIKSAGAIFRQAVKTAGLNDGIIDRQQKIVFHSLRHTFASWLIQNGTSLEVVSKLLGHTSLQMTLRYAHLANEQQLAAVRSLDFL